MRTYTCSCGQKLFYDNTQCLNCGSRLGFDPSTLALLPISSADSDKWRSSFTPDQEFHLCKNYRSYEVCNWLIPAEQHEEYCEACRLNKIIPDLSQTTNLQRWYKLEKAKRRLLYTLKLLKLTYSDYRHDPDHGLAFQFMEDVRELNPLSEEMVTYQQIMTGHNAGTITINIAEADDSVREKTREELNEAYRSILGHFRHEIGHYYWDKLIARTNFLQGFRQLFGDERNDYRENVSRYYEYGPSTDWQNCYISAYASCHPWEDWAESFAHYLHCMDILETAQHHQLGFNNLNDKGCKDDFFTWLSKQDFDHLLEKLAELTTIMNELNRGLGLLDAYPFEHNQIARDKLAFIHHIVLNYQP